jgi:hypothetical protein
MMIAVKKQFLYDDHQKPVKVLMDYDEWLRIESLLGGKEVESNGHLLEELCGKVDFGGDPMEIQRKMRSEWPD